MPGRPVTIYNLVPPLAVLVSAAWYRFKDVDHLLFGSDQMITLMAGIRLHLVSWWNLGAPIRENFFKSALMSIHGLGDSAFFYPVVGFFRLLRIPVTEAYLYSAGAALSVASLGLLWLMVRRLFGMGPALAVLVLAAWNPLLVECATTGYQINFVFFLQIATLYSYVLHATKNRWGWSLLAAALVVLCAGSELFYIGPVLLGMHWACRRSAAPGTAAGWLSPKNLVVWGAYAMMLLVNVLIFLQLPPRLDLTLFGHLLLKPSIQQSWSPAYNFQMFVSGFDGLIPLIPGASLVVIWLSLAVIVSSALRRHPFAVAFALYWVFIGGLTYAMRLTHLYNVIHVLVPSLVVIGVAMSHLAQALVSRLSPASPSAPAPARGGPGELAAGLACALIMLPLVGPWAGKIRPVEHTPPAYASLKAVGYAVRELGHPGMRVMILSNHAFMPASMEYYLGLSATFGDGHPTGIYVMQNDTEAYYPSRLAERTGTGACDFYVDLVQESFSGKPAALADLESLKLHEVAQVYDQDGSLHARIYSPREAPLKRLTIEEGNAGFNRTYAHWGKLFHDAYVGTIWYFGVNY